MTKLKEPFLPLGTVVTLVDTMEFEPEHSTYFIVARAIIKNSEEEIVPRYRVAPHPYGDIPSQEILSINADEIEDILFKGFENAEDEAFVNMLLDKMKNYVSNPTQGSLQKPDQPQKKVVSEQERLAKDPFYKFKN
ncbi:DUF4176 domain-containing protein [Streptococcus cuniculi]|uniref:DUF4176 domain-containing protein n=1 Tax=Streptococcus cuniculi TaxID=1432788 RepID=A0A4Y9JD90_9STRE|nr:DUF4176 domain-containing protein [Streptococcus cuniculi]MBF0777456.1 DUF4176 domain-containing protein [Streptococcus cuniculi]TFU98511.1 DUF4176 domain-containing protein [Streptococcus cuniculi]